MIMSFLGRVKPKYLVSWHQPLIGVDSYAVKDRKLMHRLSQGLDIPIRYLDCHGSCHGTMTGWYNSQPLRRGDHGGVRPQRALAADHEDPGRERGAGGDRRPPRVAVDPGPTKEGVVRRDDRRDALALSTLFVAQRLGDHHDGSCDGRPRSCIWTSTPSSPRSSNGTSRRCAASRWSSAGLASVAWWPPRRTRPGCSGSARRCRPPRRAAAARTPPSWPGASGRTGRPAIR